jgi:hypothetical protein
MNDTGFACIGTVDRMVETLDRYWDQTGGFGTMMMVQHEFADREATMRSHEMVARFVMPEFQDNKGSSRRAQDQFDWAVRVSEREGGWHTQVNTARASARTKYNTEMADRSGEQAPPLAVPSTEGDAPPTGWL